MKNIKFIHIMIGILLSGVFFLFGKLFWWLISFFIVYNGTESEPIGFYLTLPYKTVSRGDKMIVTIPQNYFNIAKDLGYDADGTFLKEIIAVSGDKISITESGILVNDILLANSSSMKTYKNISLHPQPYGSFILKPCQYWTVGNGVGSYDSRYYGVLNCNNLLKKADFLF